MWCQICPAVKPALLAGCCQWARERGLPFLCGYRSAAHSARLASSPFCRSLQTIGGSLLGWLRWLSRGEQRGLVVAKLAHYATLIYHLTVMIWFVQMCNQNQKCSETLQFKSVFDNVKHFLFLLATTSNKMATLLLQLREKRGQHKIVLVPEAKNQNWPNLCVLCLVKPPGRAWAGALTVVPVSSSHMHKAGLTRRWEDLLRFRLRHLWSRFWRH